MSFDLYAQSTLHYVSKHNLILRINQFIDVRYKKSGGLTIFSKSTTVVFITICAWCQIHEYFSVMKGFNIIFPYCAKRASCIT